MIVSGLGKGFLVFLVGERGADTRAISDGYHRITLLLLSLEDALELVVRHRSGELRPLSPRIIHTERILYVQSLLRF